MGSIVVANTNVASTTVALDTEGTEDWLLMTATPSGPPRSLNPVSPSKRLGGGDLLLNFDWIPGGATAFTQASTITKTAASGDNVQGAAVNTTTGTGYFHVSALNYGFRVRARADKGTRTLNLYVGHWSSTVNITARLMDGSAADNVSTDVIGASAQAYRKIAITYTADSVCELVVTVILTAGSATPNLTFSGATLQLGAPGYLDNEGPELEVVSPGIGSGIDSDDVIELLSSDASNEVATIDSVSVRLYGGSLVQVYDGAAWTADYNGSSSVTDNGDGTFSIVIGADVGWASTVAEIQVAATDDHANASTRSVGSWFFAQAPAITVVSPTPGVQPGQAGGFSADWATARVTPTVVDIDGADLAYACLVVRYPTDNGTLERCVYRRGKLRPGFDRYGAAAQVTATKLRITILPDEGWPSFGALAAMSFDVDAIAGGTLSSGAASS